MPDLPINQTNLALAALTACIVQTLDESQAGVRSAFEKNLENVYRSLRFGPLAETECLETLTWTRETLRDEPAPLPDKLRMPNRGATKNTRRRPQVPGAARSPRPAPSQG